MSSSTRTPVARTPVRRRTAAHIAVAVAVLASACALPGSPFAAPAGATSCAPTTTTDGNWTYVAFKVTGACDWTPSESGVTTFDYLVVAGGGGGGRRHGGGGGAGGMRWGSGAFGSSKTLSISVGAGGAGAPYDEGNFGSGSPGSDSSMSYTSACNPGSSSTITAVGGGRGGGAFEAAGSGGSGGSTMLSTTGTGAPLLGNAGVTWTVDPPVYTSGGGGGAGASGGPGTLLQGGDGGAGSPWLPGVFTPTIATTGLGLDNALVSAGDVYFAGGGGGGADKDGSNPDLPGGAGGLGGGGAGGQGGADASIAADLTPVFGKDALPNSGGGGGGGGLYDRPSVTNGLASKGGNGGSGVVILRYNSTDTRTALCVVPGNRAIPPGTTPAPDPSTYAFTYTNTSGTPIVPTVSGTAPACASIYATTDTAGTTHPIYCARGFDPAYVFDTSSVGTLVVGTPPGPITLVSPSSGPTSGGTSITIDGGGFVSGATVSVGTSACANVVFVNATRITCDTPSGTAGATDVTVTNPDTLSTTATGAFTYVAPAPTVSGVLPTSGPVAGGTSVTISGTGFVAGATVTIGGVACTSVSVTNDTTLTCTTGAGTAGTADVVVTVSSQASTGGTGLYAYSNASAPTVSGVLPTSGPVAGGTSVTISGTGFVAGATVTIGGVACTSVSVTSTTALTCRTGKHAAGLVDVVVTVSGQPSTGGTGLFRYVAPPPPPTALVLSALPGRQASLVWAAPASGPTPTGYQIRCMPEGYPVNIGPGGKVVYAGSVGTSVTVTGLTGGETYRCYTRARYGPDYYSWSGDYYEGPLSAASNSVWIARTTAPAPVQVAASTPPQPSGQSTSVSFVEPENRSGAPVTSFDVRCTSSNGGTTRTASGAASPVTVTSLSQGRTYRCAVRAVNSVGASAWSTLSPAIVVPAGPPTNVQVSTTTGTATVRFTAPDGGPPPRSYRSECSSSDGGTTRTGSALSSPVVVTSLTRGKTYTCRVWAVFDGSVLGPPSAPSTSFRVP